jgi:hypothetical protein
MGLIPGTYTAKIDDSQLNKLKLRVTPPVSFAIKPLRDGDVADGVDFILSSAVAPQEAK